MICCMQSASMEKEMVAAAALPDDLLAVVLGHLPARTLAASRGVCKAWRDLIDERQLLLRFLPHSVRGLFINYQDYHRPHFLSRPTPTPTLSSSPNADADDGRGGPCRIDSKFDFVKREDPDSWCEVVDHCNGLVLFLESDRNVLHVCNPATRWSARLPPCSRTWGRRAFLVFDPFVSPEYKVLLSPPELEKKKLEKDVTCRLMEWPPSAWKAWHEFSSTTGRWEEKVFVREGEAAGTAGDLLLLNEWGFHHVEPRCRYAAYWQGALYIHCHGEYVSRFSLLDDKYRVIKTPIQPAECKIDEVRTFLGRSEKGVYIAAIAEDGLAILRVWALSESSDRMEWVPKHQTNLQTNSRLWLENKKFDELKYWILDFEPEYWMFGRLDNARKNQDISLEQDDVSWNSDDDNVVDVPEDKKEVLPYLKFLGFHPYKEIIFLCNDHGNAVAFHLNSSKVQYLGTVHLPIYNRGICESFVYMTCLIGD